MDIQPALLDQVGIHRAVEIAVIDDVVDVTVDVVVVPARGDRLEVDGSRRAGAVGWLMLCSRLACHTSLQGLDAGRNSCMADSPRLYKGARPSGNRLTDAWPPHPFAG